MTNRSLMKRVIAVAIIYFVAIVALIGVRIIDRREHAYYDTFKDLIPLIFAIPAAYLAVCYQRRASYVSHLRSLWADIVEAVQGALQYTHQGNLIDLQYGSPLPNQALFGETLRALSIVIDKVRGVFRNIGEQGGYAGLYPFESLKEIFDLVSSLGFGERYKVDRALAVRLAIWQRWDILRKTLPLEFERDNPANVETRYLVDSHAVRNVRDAFDESKFTYEFDEVGENRAN